jgi:hypothetical protein
LFFKDVVANACECLASRYNLLFRSLLQSVLHTLALGIFNYWV